jgi:tetratricopeptide (TPR) repeat protein
MIPIRPCAVQPPPPTLALLLSVFCLWAGIGHAAGVPVANTALAAASAAAPFRAPYAPTNDDEVLQEVPASSDPAVLEMKAQRTKFAATPSLAAALSLAAAYIDYGRQIGDAHYAGYAEAVIAPWMAAPKPPASVLVAQATILQYRHQFSESRKLLRTALNIAPGNPQAWLTLATLDMVQGDYPSAAKDCVRVSSSAGFQMGLACSGNLRSYNGQARQSLALLQQVEGAEGQPAAAGYRGWVQGLLAEAAERLGDWPLAETHYLRALKALPRDNFLLVAYADFLLDRGRPQEVMALLADRAQSDTAFLRLALAQSALHGTETARYVWIMSARFEALTLRGSDFFGREQARFALELLHDPQAALDIAQKNWQVQREPWDTRLLLQAALAAGQPRAAVEALRFVRESRLEDPVISSLARELNERLAPVAGVIL